MSWDLPEYSFDQGQPPTPTRTPTSPSYADAFQTPRLDSGLFESKSSWNYGDASNATPNLLKTPRALLFGTPGGGSPALGNRSFGDQATSASLALNAEKLLSTPSFEALPAGQTPRFGQSPRPGEAKPRDAAAHPELSLDTSSSFRSASSMQTPPPTTTSAAKRKAQKAEGSVQAKSAASRRISVPLAPKPTHPPAPQHAHDLGLSLGPLDLSPDLFGLDFGAPATAPPTSQRLPWSHDGGDMDFLSHDPNIFDTPGQALDPFGFAGMQPGGADMSALGHGLPVHTDFMASLHASPGGSGDARPFGNGVDPNLLFSSPSKLPTPLAGNAGPHIHGISEASLQPYAYQIQEAQRSKAAAASTGSFAGVAKPKKRRKPSVDSPAVQAALETLRDDSARRPAMRRSVTDSAVPPLRAARSNPSSHGRSSPDKRAPRRHHHHHRPSLALTIDANGKARTEQRMVSDTESGSSDDGGDDDDAMDLDGAASRSPSPPSAADASEPELPAHPPRAAAAARPRMGRFSHSSSAHSHKSSQARAAASLGPVREASFGKEVDDEAVSDGDGGAQAALARIMRGRRASRHGGPSPREHALHSADAHAASSPGTVTDPDATTPREAGIRCVCGRGGGEGEMVQWNWLHVPCTGLAAQRLPEIYLCLFCTGLTPVARGGRVREPARMGYGAPSSPLAGKGRFR